MGQHGVRLKKNGQRLGDESSHRLTGCDCRLNIGKSFSSRWFFEDSFLF